MPLLQELVSYFAVESSVKSEWLISDFLGRGVAWADMFEYFEQIVYAIVLDGSIRAHPALRDFSGGVHDQLRRTFQDLDLELIEVEREQVASRLGERRVPQGQARGRVRDYTELAVIRQQAGLQRPSLPIRRLLQQAPRASVGLKPIFLMSPLSVGHFLAPGGVKFDLLVIDEASQMLPEDSLSAIARARQVVVVGDPEQLPPTTFFAFRDGAADAEDEEDGEPEESILELAQTRYHPMRFLNLHYRSRHESLIAFSNRHFYNDRLVVFPSPHQKGPQMGVAAVHVASGLYTVGTGLNINEALSVVDEAREFMTQNPNLSLGIATVNQKSQEFIEQQLEELAQRDSAVGSYVARWEDTLDAFFVKNLENVQGDERDVIFVSTVYGPTQPGGRVPQRFGPINSATGHRRLNVLFTRARQHLRLFTSMRPIDVHPTERSRKGVEILKSYLDYASNGQLASHATRGGEPESDFEHFVVERLLGAGYEAVCQVGVGGYRIDIAVVDPADPTRYLLGIECDGASYHSSKAARDRDRIREEILKGYGWRLYRIWSTDWFANPEGEFNKLRTRLDEVAGGTHRARPGSAPHVDEGATTALDANVPTDEGPADPLAVSETSSSGTGRPVHVGDRVTFTYEDTGNTATVWIGEGPPDAAETAVSLGTPVARALLGSRIGEHVEVALPRGTVVAFVDDVQERPA